MHTLDGRVTEMLVIDYPMFPRWTQDEITDDAILLGYGASETKPFALMVGKRHDSHPQAWSANDPRTFAALHYVLVPQHYHRYPSTTNPIRLSASYRHRIQLLRLGRQQPFPLREGT